MILVVSSPTDGHASAILETLEAAGAEAMLLDLSAFPRELQLSMEFERDAGFARYELTHNGVARDLSECGVVWWRRPQSFVIHEAVGSAVDRAFAFTEGQAAFSGLWLCLDTFWINHPTRDEEASRKVYQLQMAQAVGLPVPRTCVTNDPATAKQFIESVGVNSTVYKAFAGTEEAWRETRVLRPGEVEQLDAVKYAPVIFQEYIPPGVDLRITAVNGEMFPAAIHVRDTSYPADFRMSMDEARIEAMQLPTAVTDKLRLLMQRLGLVYGAIDMRLSDTGEYVFFEVNPAGQWLFVENATGQPIARALATLMVEKDRAAQSRHGRGDLLRAHA
jgi:glutathione synthase/RimK-type ligase-like ATP-grasp enzyme